jgi:hypothetical protein
MPNCPNCGRDTKRTEDWACQWCGYPLLSGAYKVIPKTYQQVKEERLCQSKMEAGLMAEPEAEVELKQDLEVIREIKLEPEPEAEKEAPELVVEEEAEEEVKAEAEVLEEPEAEKEAPELVVEEEVGPEAEVIVELEVEEAAESQPETEPEAEKEAPELEVEEAAEAEPEAEPELGPPEMELTVDELLATYAADDAAADERFVNRVIRLTGVVSSIDVKNVLDINSIRLTGSNGDQLQSVQCMFDKKYSAELAQLEIGQTATVQGRYNGSLIAMRMVGCALVC